MGQISFVGRKNGHAAGIGYDRVSTDEIAWKVQKMQRKSSCKNLGSGYLRFQKAPFQVLIAGRANKRLI